MVAHKHGRRCAYRIRGVEAGGGRVPLHEHVCVVSQISSRAYILGAEVSSSFNGCVHSSSTCRRKAKTHVALHSAFGRAPVACTHVSQRSVDTRFRGIGGPQSWRPGVFLTISVGTCEGGWQHVLTNNPNAGHRLPSVRQCMVHAGPICLHAQLS